LAAALSALCGLWAPAAHAEEAERPLPDYDGRGEPPTTTGQVLLWIPRIVFSPVYLITEFVLRRPIGFVIAGAERAGIPATLYDFFTFGTEHQAGIVPTLLINFDFYVSVGLYAFWDNAFVKGHDMRLRGSFGGNEWRSAAFSDRWRYTSDPFDRIAIEPSLERRPDYTFFGLGYDSRQSSLVRFGQDRLQLRGLIDKRIFKASSVQAEVALRHVEFRRGGYKNDEELDDAIANGELPSPPGYDTGYFILRSGLTLTLDSRSPRPAPGSGVRLVTAFAHSADLRDSNSFVGYGSALTGFLDLNGRSRVVSLSVGARFADPIGDAVIPFTELVTLGGTEPMRGLYEGRLIDRSAAVAAIGYRWPIWIWLDGALRAEIGNVFAEHLDGFELKRLRWSASLGAGSNGSTDSAFEIGVGVGSETFESGGTVNSFRFVAGTTHGF